MRFADSFYICMCVFHSIRFKVNKVLGHGGDPFFVFIPFKTLDFCSDSSAFSGKSSQIKTQKMRSFAGRISYDSLHSYLSLEIEESSYFFFLNFR